LSILPVFAFDNGDFQLWNADEVDWKMNDRLKANVEQELRFGKNVQILYYTHTDGSLTFKANDYLDLGMAYRQIYEKSGGKGKWKEENRPHANVTLNWKLYDLKFKYRNRLELRVREDKDDAWRYRGKLCLYSPWKWTDLNIQPYVADEIFIDFEGDKLNRNRLYAGIKMDIIEHVKAGLFYLWQTSEKKTGKWDNYNVLGIEAKLAF
jgi:hypothetical protein